MAINVATFNIGDAAIDPNRSCRNIRGEILNAIQRNAAINGQFAAPVVDDRILHSKRIDFHSERTGSGNFKGRTAFHINQAAKYILISILAISNKPNICSNFQMMVCTGLNDYRRLGRFKVSPGCQSANRNAIVSRVIIHPDHFNIIACWRFQKALHLIIGRNAVGVARCTAACRCTAAICCKGHCGEQAHHHDEAEQDAQYPFSHRFSSSF